jgi:glycogen synthase
MTAAPRRRLRIAYIAGPADGPSLFREWSAGGRRNFFGTDYMKEFFRLATDLEAESYVVTWSAGEKAIVRQGAFTFDNRPLQRPAGLRYHLFNIIWFLRLMPDLARFRADVLILTGNYNYWWVLAALRWLGTAFIPSYHGVLWRRFGPVRLSWRVLVRLNAALVLRRARIVVAASGAIARQAERLLGGGRGRPRIITHLPTYHPDQFASIPPPAASRDPFRVLFVGRIVADKGVYDLLEVARRLDADRNRRFHFDLCGDGVDFEDFQQRVRALGLEHMISCHGFSGPDKIQQLLGASHACIVPTRSEIEVGFEMTCAEAILAGRPLITSEVCPALEYIRDGAIEVAPNSVDGYHQALLLLSEDEQLYEAKREATLRLQHQFYDPKNSWYAAMRECLADHLFPPAGPRGELAGSALPNRARLPNARRPGAGGRRGT